jgi:cytochrome b561
MRIALLALSLGLAAIAPATARGEAAPTAEPPPEAAPKAPDLSVKPPNLDFLLLDEKAPLPARDPRFEEQVQRRRTLLSVHQAVGLATWGLMASTVVVGQLNYNDLYGGGGYTQRYREPHVALVGATTASFAFSGILALAAPRPYPRPLRFDTATVHKFSMGLTTLGFVGQIALGYLTHNPGNLDQRQLARAHQALGYATFGTMTIGAVTLLF